MLWPPTFDKHYEILLQGSASHDNSYMRDRRSDIRTLLDGVVAMTNHADEFLSKYIDGFHISGTSTYNINNPHEFYLDLMLAQNTKEDLLGVAREFQFMAADAATALKNTKYSFETIHQVLLDRDGPEELYPVILPNVILHADTIGKEIQAPPYVVAVQYVRSILEKLDLMSPQEQMERIFNEKENSSGQHEGPAENIG